MLVVGTEPVYLSHLPMFHPPHNFQVLLEVDLVKTDGSSAVDEYREDRESTGETLYTLEPEKFALRELDAALPDSSRRTSFKGTLYRGHFERGGREFLSDLTIDVVDVIYFHEFEAPAQGPPEVPPQLEYLCFGKPERRFLAHLIRRPPSFDHVLTMRFVDDEVAKMSFPKTPVEIPDREDGLEQRLREGVTVTGFLYQAVGPQGQHGFRAELSVEEELYLESGELEA
jgi:hypothetical protein